MHHVHGLVNVMNCAIWAKATCELREVFKVEETWKALLRDRSDPDALSLFMAVPTIYYNLIKYYHDSKLSPKFVKERLSSFRLMVAGSASLPGPTLDEWEHISG
jgi:malonyl-CoA/methylmalonyl-CoA synthetase